MDRDLLATVPALVLSLVLLSSNFKNLNSLNLTATVEEKSHLSEKEIWTELHRESSTDRTENHTKQILFYFPILTHRPYSQFSSYTELEFLL